eukprot:CAMPEP_0196680600 /NCGR_PEP_ID=MMETSP1090-20130531/7912_1 /TAXON_ID=37098 /ORGANISM="Isochrysis sp, Strain CCMP1244" /LENGTH=119 /DNA_ID=CAMNT_0042018913 /DNA_START=253 /DNA_END=608 /DNA_ORIENTATION=+
MHGVCPRLPPRRGAQRRPRALAPSLRLAEAQHQLRAGAREANLAGGGGDGAEERPDGELVRHSLLRDDAAREAVALKGAVDVLAPNIGQRDVDLDVGVGLVPRVAELVEARRLQLQPAG